VVTDPVGLADLGVAELLTRYRAGEATPLDATEACLARIAELEPQVNAIITLLPERALEQAEDSTRRWQEDRARPLEGIPYGLKDIIATAGVRTTGASRLFSDNVPVESAAVAERLEAAGGVLLGKLQTLELAAGIRNHFGRTHNPWDPDRLAAGSSSGSAAALAARMMPLTIGTDTGGSILIPAAFCGVTGLKATYGRVPRNGVMTLSWTLDHVGPMTRSAQDAAHALGALAGYDARDPTSSRHPIADYLADLETGVQGLRIGVPRDWFFDVCDPQIADATHAAIDVLVSAGAERAEVGFPATARADPHAIELFTYLPEAASLHEIHWPRNDEFGPDYASLLDKAQVVSAADYIKALRSRHLLQQDFEAAFERVDVIVVPGCVTVAPRHDHLVCHIGDNEVPLLDAISRTTAIFNETGVPALTVPAGLSGGSLPMAISIAARPFAEATVLRVGHAFQSLTDHHRALPPLLERVVYAD
jgi:aspartyl-tRNA(Asn)/glutamyl-tRNA(Gln) amidotransferase subunit A